MGSIPDDAHPMCLSCYRSLLCEAEVRDCWYARPMETERMPFVFEGVLEYLTERGTSCEWGLDTVSVILNGNIPLSDKVTMLEELVAHPDKFMAEHNYAPADAMKALEELRSRSG